MPMSVGLDRNATDEVSCKLGSKPQLTAHSPRDLAIQYSTVPVPVTLPLARTRNVLDRFTIFPTARREAEALPPPFVSRGCSALRPWHDLFVVPVQRDTMRHAHVRSGRRDLRDIRTALHMAQPNHNSCRKPCMAHPVWGNPWRQHELAHVPDAAKIRPSGACH